MYVSLHNHTHFSILDSLLSPEFLILKTKEAGQTAVALTDHGSLAGAWACLKAAKKTGIKLIIGCEMFFTESLDSNSRLRHIVLLAKNEIGYKNLLELNADGFDNYIISSKKTIPRITWEHLEKHKEGLICTTACGNGIISQLISQKKFAEAEATASRLLSIFGEDLAIELQPHALVRHSTPYSEELDQTFINKQLKKISEKLNIKAIVATNAHYASQDEHEVHDVLMAVNAGQPVTSQNRLKYNVNDFYIKTEEQVFEKLKRSVGEDFARKCIDNSVYFADKCGHAVWINPKWKDPKESLLPTFDVKGQPDYKEFLSWNEYPSLAEDARYYRFICFRSLDNRIKAGLIPANEREKYVTQMLEEFDVLEARNFSSYMLIVNDFIEWARNNNIFIGPGRGSVGGSVTAYLLDIHIANPFRYGLLFSRFLNKFKEDYPDIDVDISSAGRASLQQYIKNKYGENNFAYISNLNTLTPKVYAKNICKAFIFGGDRKEAVKIGMNIADAIPNEVKKLSKAFVEAPLFMQYVEDYPQLKKCEKIEGLPFALATHAGGIIVASKPLRGLVPLRKDKDNTIAIEYDKKAVEENGLIKIDTLGVQTLDVILSTIELIKASGKDGPKSPYDIKFDEYDKLVYDLIGAGKTLCVFQLGESAETIDLCRKIQPKSIDELAMINTLARPAARDIRDHFCKTKNGEIPVVIKNKLLEGALKDTYGFPIFEECLMFIAKDVAGWSLHKADNLRKLTKLKGKDPEAEIRWKNEFVEDSVKNGVDESVASDIWVNIIQKFGGYAFNKSHSVEYSITGYWTAYLKAHFPLEFLVANLLSEISKNSPKSKLKILKIKEEIKALNVKIVPPNINESFISYKIVDDNTLLTGLDALRDVGSKALPEIVEKRPFKSFEDFIERVDARKINSKSICGLAASGALDCFNLPRKMMYLYGSDYKKKFVLFAKNKLKNPAKYTSFDYPWPEMTDWTDEEKFAMERQYLGEGLNANKFKVFSGFFTNRCVSFAKLNKLLPEPVGKTEAELKKYKKEIKGVQAEIKSIFEFKVKKEDSKFFGETMAKMSLEDPYGYRLTMTCFPDGLSLIKDKLKKKRRELEAGCAVHINGELQWYQGNLGINFSDITKFAMPPQPPKDLKPKKVSMRVSKIKTLKEVEDRHEFVEAVEDYLIETGNEDL